MLNKIIMNKNSKKLSEQIAETLTDKILSGDYDLNTFLPSERELQEEYDASRPIIRESLQILATRGLVTSSSRKGTVVNPNINQPVLQAVLLACVRSNVFLEDLLNARYVLESQIAVIAAEKITVPQSRELLDLLSQQEALDFADIQQNGATKWRNLDMQFHLLIAHATQNEVFTILIEVLIGILLNQRHTEMDATVTQESLSTAIQYHRAITEAIVNHDSEKAGEAMKNHLAATMRNYENFSKGRVQRSTE